MVSPLEAFADNGDVRTMYALRTVTNYSPSTINWQPHANRLPMIRSGLLGFARFPVRTESTEGRMVHLIAVMLSELDVQAILA